MLELTNADLKIVLQLVGRANIQVSEVPAVWPTLLRLEQASQLGASFTPIVEHNGQDEITEGR